MGGLAVGILSGLFVASLGVAALSLSSPLPPRGVDAAAEDVAEDVVEDVAEDADQNLTEDAAEPTDDTTQADLGDAVEAGVPAEQAAEPAQGDTADPAPQPADVPEAATADSEGPRETTGPATEIPLPAGTEFNRPPPVPEAALPSAETAPAAAAPNAPALAAEVRAPSFEIDPPAQPSAGSETPVAPTASAAPSMAPARPAPEEAPMATEGPSGLSEPDIQANPEVETATLAPSVAEDSDPLPETMAPAIEEEAQPEEESAEQEDTVAALIAPDVPQPSRLPQAGLVPEASLVPEVQTEDGAAQDDASMEQPEADQPQSAAEDQPAIRAFAAEFDTTQAGPLMSVVLIDQPDSWITQDTLTRFNFPVAFAVDPLHPDAAERAAAYRAAGFEVVILSSMIGEGATASDVEVSLASAQGILPEAVAVLDTPEGRIQGDRPVLDAVVGVLAETGHGLVAFPQGLNAAEQTANRVGVPGGTVFRLLDEEDQRATVITRFLSRAAFTAGQEGTAIVVGHTRPDTVTALFSWALGGRTEGVILAPLSATLERASES